jgi:C4-dicarboxylate-specific signal transduction histidine kinase
MNAIKAISGALDGTRTLLVSTIRDAAHGGFVVAYDSGPGLDLACLSHLFDALHTAKPSGIGMGLLICRLIVEGPGRRLWIRRTYPRALCFSSLPPHQEILS